MRSDGRSVLHKNLRDIQNGQVFQLVNSVMGAAFPRSLKLEKVDTDKARRLDTNEIVTLRLDSVIELC